MEKGTYSLFVDLLKDNNVTELPQMKKMVEDGIDNFTIIIKPCESITT